jgi:hypothetical protein
MFEILASFPVSIFLYRVFFRVSYLGNIQILSVFVVLGVGADDVFVFFDAFKQSAYEPSEVSGSTLTRVLYTARRASKAIFVTSLTTAVAFAATAMSKVMPISAFGALSAIMIFVLFAVNVLFFPPALVLYDRWVRNAARRRANGEGKLAACLGGFGCKGKNPGRDVAARADEIDDVGSESSGDVAVVVGVDDASSSSDGAGALSSDASRDREEQHVASHEWTSRNCVRSSGSTANRFTRASRTPFLNFSSSRVSPRCSRSALRWPPSWRRPRSRRLGTRIRT